MSGRQLLPTNVRPVWYDITLEPELEPRSIPGPDASGVPNSSQTPENASQTAKQQDRPGNGVEEGATRANDEDDSAFVFHGQEVVELEVVQDTREIVLNALELKIHVARVGDVEAQEICYDADAQTATLVFQQAFSAGQHIQLALSFQGVLNSKMVGFYRAKYKSQETDSVKYMAVTQFEPTDARQAFPCWDEPALKSRFRITLVVPSDRVAVSNMPVENESVRKSDGKKVVRFAETPLMSTYLVAFVVGEFDYLEASTSDGVQVRVYTQKGVSHQGSFALDCAVRVLSFFTDFFGTSYPLPKEDLIAIPDFAAGAMENWGCITFRETALLLDAEKSAASARSRVAEVVAHELAHQWFGNLVTMEWWTHLWLNEGFATWAAELAVDHLFPSWQQWMQFVSTTFAAALRLDALRSSHPIEVEIARAQQVNEIFDAISYCKGASVIRMLANYLGLEVFRDGLRRYLRKFTYGNASTDDLWHALEEESGKPIAQMMRSWTRQTGYPVIYFDDAKMMVRQERFLADGGVACMKNALSQDCQESDPKPTCWTVPLGVIDSARPAEARYMLMDQPEAVLSSTGLVSNQEQLLWMKLNPHQTGTYRVNYSLSMWQKLVEPIRNKTLSATDRLGLAMDAFALTKAGLLPASVALQTLAAFSKEDEYACWLDVVGSLGELGAVFASEEASLRDQFDRFACELLRHTAQQLGWKPKTDEEHVTALLRSLLVGALVKHSDSNAVAEARRLWKAELEGTDRVPADLRLAVMSSVVQHGSETDFETVLGAYANAPMDEERVRCIRALGCTRDTAKIRWLLDWGLDRSQVKSQDAIYVYSTLAANTHKGRQAAWSYLRENWPVFYQRFGKGNFLLSSFVSSILRDFSTEEMASEAEEFFNAVPEKERESILRTIQQSVERIRANAAWRKRDSPAVREWLSELYG
jgi:puromycin-sensitive aminopeptidase